MSNIIRIGPRNLLLLPENAQWRNRFQIAGSTGNLYTVAQRKSNGSWACSCPGWIRHRHCKHLSALANDLKLLGG